MRTGGFCLLAFTFTVAYALVQKSCPDPAPPTKNAACANTDGCQSCFNAYQEDDTAEYCSIKCQSLLTSICGFTFEDGSCSGGGGGNTIDDGGDSGGDGDNSAVNFGVTLFTIAAAVLLATTV